MLHTKYQSCGPMVSEKKIFLVFPIVQYTRRDSSIILASRVDFEHFPRKKNKKLARKIREFRMNFARNFVASRGTFPRYARAWRGNFTCGGKSSRVDGTKITWNLKYVLTQ